jgi:hypothetical protein
MYKPFSEILGICLAIVAVFCGCKDSIKLGIANGFVATYLVFIVARHDDTPLITEASSTFR